MFLILKLFKPSKILLWKEWCWSWSSSTLVTSCEELTHWKRLWYWEGLGEEEGDDREWDCWMTSLTRWTLVWVNSRSWWWTERLGMLRFMGSQRVRHDLATELNWTELMLKLWRTGTAVLDQKTFWLDFFYHYHQPVFIELLLWRQHCSAVKLRWDIKSSSGLSVVSIEGRDRT